MREEEGGATFAKPISLWRGEFALGEFRLQRIEVPKDVHSLDDVTRLLPHGVYTTLVVYPQRRVLRFSAHVHRLQESAHLAGYSIEVPERPLRDALRRILPLLEGQHRWRVRLVLHPQIEKRILLYFILEVMPPPEEGAYSHGAQVITFPFQRELPRAKLTQFIEQSSVLRQKLSGGVEEVLLVDQAGFILEGLSSNFFAFKGRSLFTAEEGVLHGVTRQLVLEAAQHLSIPIVFQPIAIEELIGIREAFLTSSSRGVMPVVRIDDKLVGNGRVGEQTQALRQAYQERVGANLEEL